VLFCVAKPNQVASSVELLLCVIGKHKSFVVIHSPRLDSGIILFLKDVLTTEAMYGL
jgi:hypothetical protein